MCVFVRALMLVYFFPCVVWLHPLPEGMYDIVCASLTKLHFRLKRVAVSSAANAVHEHKKCTLQCARKRGRANSGNTSASGCSVSFTAITEFRWQRLVIYLFD